MEEHKIILNFVDMLRNTIEKLNSVNDFDEVADEMKTLTNISGHLVEANLHHQREEDVLFPALKKFGVVEPPEVMKMEHEELKPRKAELRKLAMEYKKMLYSDFIKRINEITNYIIKELPEHIYKENNILYPIAVQIIPEDEWVEIKRGCDSIGYCCFTPGS